MSCAAKRYYSSGSIWVLLLVIFPLHAQAETPAAKTRIEIEVIIPERTAMYFTEDGKSAVSKTDTATTFDLSCATHGALPGHCRSRLLDTQGRAYPPRVRDADGAMAADGDFPQYFESALKTLRIFTPMPAWTVQVDMVEEPGALSADNFSVFSSLNGWRCLGFHPDWRLSPALETCPTSTDAARKSVPVVASSQALGGWFDITLGLKLRLDGSEPAGTYNGVLRYTLVNF